MEIVRIIDAPEPVLYAVQYTGEEIHELYRNIDLWIDPEYLREFFKTHEKDLKSYCEFHEVFYSINDAVRKTINDIENLEQVLIEKAENGISDEEEILETLFKPLHNKEKDQRYALQESKATLDEETWLRLYAIRIDKHLYVITGGAIKLTETMNERDHTKTELKKMDQVVQYLRNEDLINEEEFEKFELGI
ncbi:hypothetical protein [Gracilimonas mengyeensis]|uniref:Uncharacterized protein n=1 Tax=Gracilimonas mengyeensis TaxID=1302730 RepID=A0A521ACC1_9BACT|nr:hypothetical protein [Gracilimonas mengyeensis]SMO32474.1 hypothetical protein SAMN06265219_10150 [Gracilimonas mengyeensis]